MLSFPHSARQSTIQTLNVFGTNPNAQVDGMSGRFTRAARYLPGRTVFSLISPSNTIAKIQTMDHRITDGRSRSVHSATQ
jgi:hypothetical protein